MVELANCLAEQPQWIVDRLADRHLGITAAHKTFPPAIGEIIDMVANLHEMRARMRYYSEAQSRRTGPQAPVRAPFRPYPKLWEAFAGDTEALQALDNAESFDWLTAASKRLATRGRDAARKLICPPSDLPTPPPTEKAA